MAEWQEKKLGDLCDFIKGETGIAKAIPGSYPLVTTGAERKTCKTFQFNTKAVCLPIISSAGHGKKSLNYIHYQEGKFALGSILVAIIPKNEAELSAKYLHLYLSHFKDYILVPLMKGAANVSLPIKAVQKIQIPVPSITRQKELTELVENIDSDYREINNELDHQQSLIKQLRQAILQEAVEGKLTADWRKANPELISGENHAAHLLEKIKAEKERLVKEGKIQKQKPLPPITDNEKSFDLPEGWAWCRLGDISSKIGSGSTPRGGKDVYKSSGIKFFRSQNIYDDGLRYDDIVFIDLETHEKMKSTEVEPHDVLLNITGGSIGRAALVPDDFDTGNVSQHVTIIRLIILNSKYVHKFVQSPFFQKFIYRSTTGAGREGLPKYNLEKFAVPNPPLTEQQAIVEKVDRLMTKIDALEQQVSKRKAQAEQLMQAVLREAFEGA